jgi:hypothetical protein
MEVVLIEGHIVQRHRLSVYTDLLAADGNLQSDLLGAMTLVRQRATAYPPCTTVSSSGLTLLVPYLNPLVARSAPIAAAAAIQAPSALNPLIPAAPDLGDHWRRHFDVRQDFQICKQETKSPGVSLEH